MTHLVPLLLLVALANNSQLHVEVLLCLFDLVQLERGWAGEHVSKKMSKTESTYVRRALAEGL